MCAARKMVLSEGQVDIITRLSSSSGERKMFLERFLKSNGMKRVGDLTMKEASGLIDELSRISGEVRIEHFLSSHQLDFLDQLQDTNARRGYTGDYLASRGKKSIHSLSGSEASELISVLQTMKPPSEGEKLDAPITIKQLERINELQDTEERREFTDRFIVQTLGKELNEMTRQEADELIGLLE